MEWVLFNKYIQNQLSNEYFSESYPDILYMNKKIWKIYDANTYYKQSEGFIWNTKLKWCVLWILQVFGLTLKPCDCVYSTVNYSTYYSNIGDMFGAHLNVPVKP